MTQANVQKRDKNKVNNDKPGPESQLPQMPQVQMINAVVVPVEIFDKMKHAIKCLPVNEVELLLGAMKNLQPQQVTMTQAPGQG
jgi:hypothetical protein